jgi:hypothetical protein
MNERAEVNHKAAAPGQVDEPGCPAKPPGRPWPSREDRLARIREYQAKALENEDPHLGSLELLDGDTMLLALQIRQLMDNDLTGETATAEASRRFAQRSELFLKCVRQIDRNASIKRQIARMDREERGLE